MIIEIIIIIIVIIQVSGSENGFVNYNLPSCMLLPFCNIPHVKNTGKQYIMSNISIWNLHNLEQKCKYSIKIQEPQKHLQIYREISNQVEKSSLILIIVITSCTYLPLRSRLLHCMYQTQVCPHHTSISLNLTVGADWRSQWSPRSPGPPELSSLT